MYVRSVVYQKTRTHTTRFSSIINNARIPRKTLITKTFMTVMVAIHSLNSVNCKNYILTGYAFSCVIQAVFLTVKIILWYINVKWREHYGVVFSANHRVNSLSVLICTMPSCGYEVPRRFCYFTLSTGHAQCAPQEAHIFLFLCQFTCNFCNSFVITDKSQLPRFRRFKR